MSAISVLHLSLLACLGAAALAAGWALLPEDAPVETMLALARVSTAAQALGVVGRPADRTRAPDDPVEEWAPPQTTRVLRWHRPGTTIEVAVDQRGEVLGRACFLQPRPTTGDRLARWLGW